MSKIKSINTDTNLEKYLKSMRKDIIKDLEDLTDEQVEKINSVHGVMGILQKHSDMIFKIGGHGFSFRIPYKSHIVGITESGSYYWIDFEVDQSGLTKIIIDPNTNCSIWIKKHVLKNLKCIVKQAPSGSVTLKIVR